MKQESESKLGKVRVYHVNDGTTKKFYATDDTNKILNYPFSAYLIDTTKSNRYSFISKIDTEVIPTGNKISVVGRSINDLFLANHPGETKVEKMEFMTDEEYLDLLKNNRNIRIYSVYYDEEKRLYVTNNENLIYGQLDGPCRYEALARFNDLFLKGKLPTEFVDEVIPIGKKVAVRYLNLTWAMSPAVPGKVSHFQCMTIPEYSEILTAFNRLKKENSLKESEIKGSYKSRFEDLESQKKGLEREMQLEISILPVRSLDKLIQDEFP